VTTPRAKQSTRERGAVIPMLGSRGRESRSRKPEVLPHDLNLERRLLAMLLCPWPSRDTAAPAIAAGLEPDHFFRQDWQPAARACIELHAEGVTPNTMLVSQRLTETELAAVRGIAGLEKVTDGVPPYTAEQLIPMVRTAVDLAWRRGRIVDLEHYRARLYDVDESIDALYAEPETWQPCAESGVRPLLSGVALLERPDVPWQVAGLIQHRGLVLVSGKSNSGKSQFTFSLGCSLVQNKHTSAAWFGQFDINPDCAGDVVLAFSEGHHGIKPRLQTGITAYGLTQADLRSLHFHLDPLSLQSDEDVSTFIRRAPTTKLAAACLDCWAQMMLPGDENKQQDAGIAVAALKRIQRALETTVIVTHHVGVSDTRERGSTVLRDAVDTSIRVTQVKNGVRVVTCDKQRDAEYFKPWRFRLEASDPSCFVVYLGADESGDDADGPDHDLIARAQKLLTVFPQLSNDALVPKMKCRRKDALEALRGARQEGLR
jgi:hypothetical protein